MSETAGRKKIALVTGATDGVGRYVASRLAAAGYHVLVHGRDQGRGESLMREISEAGGTAQFYPADLSSLQQVRDLAQAVLLTQDWLDLLINNAGIGTTNAEGSDGREESVDGFELRFAVNYLAPFLLTRLLLPNLLAAAPARIVNVASVGQQDLDFEDLQFERGYSGVGAYCRSKLALIMFTFDLAKELAGTGVTVNAVHPASLMDTYMVREAGATPMSTVEEGADAIMNLAVSPQMSGRTGEYFDRLVPARARAQAYDAAAREKLRQATLALVGLQTETLRETST